MHHLQLHLSIFQLVFASCAKVEILYFRLSVVKKQKCVSSSSSFLLYDYLHFYLCLQTFVHPMHFCRNLVTALQNGIQKISIIYLTNIPYLTHAMVSVYYAMYVFETLAVVWLIDGFCKTWHATHHIMKLHVFGSVFGIPMRPLVLVNVIHCRPSSLLKSLVLLMNVDALLTVRKRGCITMSS